MKSYGPKDFIYNEANFYPILNLTYVFICNESFSLCYIPFPMFSEGFLPYFFFLSFYRSTKKNPSDLLLETEPGIMKV